MQWLSCQSRPGLKILNTSLLWCGHSSQRRMKVARTEDRLTGYVTRAGASSKASLFRNKTSYQGMLQYTHSSGNKITIYYLSLWFYAMPSRWRVSAFFDFAELNSTNMLLQAFCLLKWTSLSSYPNSNCFFCGNVISISKLFLPNSIHPVMSRLGFVLNSFYDD